MTEPKILPPRSPAVQEFFDEASDLASLTDAELHTLLCEQTQALWIKANHAALKVLKMLSDKNARFSTKEREQMMKELMGYGMFADSINRQRNNLLKLVAPSDGLEEEKPRGPTLAIPASLNNEDWEKKYSNMFMDKTAQKDTKDTPN